MQRYIALFRGINVGGKNIVPMKELAQTFEGLGYSAVQTYIQSGNVVFNAKGKADAVASEIQKALLQAQGVDARVMVMDAASFANAVANSPYPVEEGKALHLFFLDSVAAKPNLERLVELQGTTEQFQLIDKVFYLHAPDGIGRSKLAASVEKCLGVPVTARNGNTVTKLMHMLGSQ